MKKIKEYRMSLMEKDSKESSIEGKSNYIIRYSAVLEVDNYVKGQDFNEKEYHEFIVDSSKMIFEELLKNRKGKYKNIDSVGLWIIYEDKTEIDNAIDLSILNEIENYGSDDVEPIKEFFKMTLK